MCKTPDLIPLVAKSISLAALIAAAPLGLSASAGAQDLASFAILAGSAVTNTGSSVITGNIGVSPGSAITGFPPGIVVEPYAIYGASAVASQAQSDLTTAYNVLASRPFTNDLTGQDLGGQTLTAGVYNFNTTAQLTGVVTLDGQGDPNATFVFNIGSTLTTASASGVLLINGAQAGNVFYRVGSSATLGSTTTFQGKILALTSITLVTGATIDCGAALARNGAVTLDSNLIRICPTFTGPIADDLGDDATANVTVIGTSLDDYVASGGLLPLGFQALALLTPAELAIALAQISGEVGTAVGPSGMQTMDRFLDLLRDSSAGANVVTASLDNPAPEAISVMGYAASPSSVGFPAIKAAPEPPRRHLWASVYGGYRVTVGDPVAGRNDRATRDFSLAMGLDHEVNAHTSVGIAMGGGAVDFMLANGFGTGRSTVAQIAVSARTELEAAYIAGALAYGFHNVTTDRYVTFAGIDRFTADFAAHGLGAQVEAGYDLGVITPFAALRGQAFDTPSYSEVTQSGSSTFALSHAQRTQLSARTEVGAMLDLTRPLTEGGTVSLKARAAWAHYYLPATAAVASFQSLPGSQFTVSGAPSATDSLLLSASAAVTFDSGLSLAAHLAGELSHKTQAYGGALKLGFSF